MCAQTFLRFAVQELLGHCLALYKSNGAMLTELQSHLSQYGYKPQGLSAPADPLSLHTQDEDGEWQTTGRFGRTKLLQVDAGTFGNNLQGVCGRGDVVPTIKLKSPVAF